MPEALVKVEPQAMQAQPTGSTVPSEAMEAGEAREAGKATEATEAREARKARKARKARRKSQYIRVLSTSLIRFHRKRKEARSLPSIIKTPGEQNGNLEPCGLGGIVIPSCQRFNNMRCFMIFFCILLVSQGEPEGARWGWAGGGGRGGTRWFPMKQLSSPTLLRYDQDKSLLNRLPSWLGLVVKHLIDTVTPHVAGDRGL